VETDKCVVCGGTVYDKGDVIDFYALSHIYLAMKDGHAELAPPEPGRDLIFCSAKCLCGYVNANIAPQALGER
jgi:hypothetical protein